MMVDEGGAVGVHDGIITPEAVVLEVETAGVASRLLAGLLDAVIQGIAFFVIVFVILLASFGSTGVDDGAAQAVFGFTLFAVLFGYPIVWEMATRGRTIGKAALGLRVVTVEGAPIRFRHAAVRSMGGIVDKLVPPGGLMGVCFVLGTPSKQRIGDLLAGTLVIKDPDRTSLPAGIWFPVPTGYEAYAATLDPTAITVQQYTLVRSFLLRVKELTPAARYSVAFDLAGRLASVMGVRRPDTVHPETFLLCAIARYQRRAYPAYR